MSADGMPAGADMDGMLLGNRYIGDDGLPAATAPTENAGAEFRKLPIHMTLVMDQRYVPTVITYCANSALPVEIQRVRISPEKNGVDKLGQGFEMGAAGGSVASMPGMGGRGESGGGYGGRGEGGGGSMMSSSGYSGAAIAMPTGPGTSSLATVDFQGIVYIYNPPSKEKLTLPGEEGAADPAAVAAAEPAGN